MQTIFRTYYHNYTNLNGLVVLTVLRIYESYKGKSYYFINTLQDSTMGISSHTIFQIEGLSFRLFHLVKHMMMYAETFI